MKKFIALLLTALFAAVLGAAENKIYFDNFEYPLSRTHWLKIDPHTEAWSKEWQIPASGVRWRIRFSGDRSAFKTLTVINAQGKQIFYDGACRKATWINFAGLTGKNRVEFTVISPVAQKVKVDAAWQRKTGKGRERVNQVVEVEPNKPATVSVEFVPTATPVAVTLIIEKELTVKNFNLFEVK